MKKIRRGIFETNSSSSHSIHIDSDMELMDYSLIPDENGEVNIYDGEYGSGPERLGTSKEKLEYCYTAGCDTNILKSLIEEMTGATMVNFHSTEYGYVEDNAVDSISDDRQKLKELIFNKRSVIYVEYDSRDNHPDFYCDKSIGKYKMVLLETQKHREMSINSIMGEDQFASIPEDKWVYLFNKKSDQISTAIDNYFLHFINGTGHPYNKPRTVRELEDLNLSNMSAKVKVYDYDGKSWGNTKNVRLENWKVIIQKI